MSDLGKLSDAIHTAGERNRQERAADDKTFHAALRAIAGCMYPPRHEAADITVLWNTIHSLSRLALRLEGQGR